MPRPYNKWAAVSLAASALQNQAETMLDELNESFDRVLAFRAKLAARAAENS